jgi:hypothetical protein
MNQETKEIKIRNIGGMSVLSFCIKFDERTQAILSESVLD